MLDGETSQMFELVKGSWAHVCNGRWCLLSIMVFWDACLLNVEMFWIFTWCCAVEEADGKWCKEDQGVQAVQYSTPWNSWCCECISNVSRGRFLSLSLWSLIHMQANKSPNFPSDCFRAANYHPCFPSAQTSLTLFILRPSRIVLWYFISSRFEVVWNSGSACGNPIESGLCIVSKNSLVSEYCIAERRKFTAWPV